MQIEEEEDEVDDDDHDDDHDDEDDSSSSKEDDSSSSNEKEKINNQNHSQSSTLFDLTPLAALAARLDQDRLNAVKTAEETKRLLDQSSEEGETLALLDKQHKQLLQPSKPKSKTCKLIGLGSGIK